MGNAKVRILVVDDDAFVREVLASILEADNYQVLTAENGMQALEICRTDHDVDLIVSDVNMPEMDGITLIKTLRKQQLDLPVIMVTSVSSISVAVDALSSGAIDYVLKDEGIQETITITVRRALEKHQLKKQNIQLLSDLATKTAEQQQTLSYLTAIINNMPDGLLVSNSSSIITLANPAIAQMLDIPVENLIGHNCSDALKNIFPFMDGDCKEKVSPVQATVQLAGGKTGSAIGAPVTRVTDAINQTEEFVGNLVIVRDVTAEHELDKMKDDFISTVSHELRTPLTSVLGFTRIISKKLAEVIFPALPENEPRITKAVRQIADSTQVIISEGERLTELINDLLDLSKMEAGKISWKMVDVEVAYLIERAISATAALFEQKGLGFSCDLKAVLPAVYCDADRIHQVLLNLLSNALKFTDHGLVTVRAVMDRDDPNFVRFEIKDTGIGVEAEELPLLFEKFKQSGNTLTNRPKGTGLGLTISRQIIEFHGGVIGATSTAGCGSVFYFSLPVAKG